MAADRRVPDGKRLVLNQPAESGKPGVPAFLARPTGAPVYHGFPLLEESRTDGWCLGTITEFADPDGCESGDAFVVAPDGSRAGLVWQVGAFETEVICEPDEGRCGVYSIAFPRAVRNTEDLVLCFREVLPELKAIYAGTRGRPTRG